MIINKADLAFTAVNSSGFPNTNLPEIAFVGKSNVGKSSLINAMLGRKRLARTSSTPGKTRVINFFIIEEKLYFVDLPGYGYAKVSKSESEKWGGMVEGYLKDRKPLKHIFLLIDIRHPPGKNDKMLYEWFMHYAHDFTIIATKSDKIKKSQINKHLAIVKNELSMNTMPIAFSSETKQGRDEIWEIIYSKTQTFSNNIPLLSVLV